MDNRTARRTAEKSARDLITARAALVGELGVAAADRTKLAADITTATDRGRQLIADAEAEAARLVAAAHELAAAGEQRYTDAYTAATAAGWTAADLTALGFPPGQSPAQRRRAAPPRPAATPPAASTPTPQPAPEPVTVPLQAFRTQPHAPTP